MSKIISAEIKKQVSKPGIYVLALLLAIILVLGVFIYRPTETASSSSKIKSQIAANSVTGIYSKFDGGSGAGLYSETKTKIEDAKKSVNAYRVEDTFFETKINNITKSLYKDDSSILKNYRSLATDPIYEDLVKSTNKTLINGFDNLYTTIRTALNGKSYVVVTSTENFNELESIISSIKSNFSSTFSDTTKIISDIIVTCENFDVNIKPELEKCLNKLTYPFISDDFIEDYTVNTAGTKYELLENRLNNIMDKILDLKSEAESSGVDVDKSAEKMEEMENLICSYVNTASTYCEIVKNELLVNALSSVSANEQLNLYQLNTESLYNAKTNLIKFGYLFDNDKTDDDYANPFTIGTTSSGAINAYDYAYFSLNLFAIVIIAYAVMSGCNTVAGEIKEGTMRYLAIRPVGRRKMFFGKLLSILIMSLIFIAFSSVVAFLVGGFVYSFDSLNVLTIFNGSTAIVLPAFALFGIYLLSLIVELAIYLSIAMLLATLFKSDLLAVTIVLLLYLINLILPIFTGGINSWLAFYPFSHISLYSLFGSSIYANTSDFFYLLLGAKVYSTSNIVLTSIMVIAILIGINVVSSTLFKKKEL